LAIRLTLRLALVIASTAESPMTKTYTQVLKQIEALKAEADKLRRKEMTEVIGRIREAIEHYGLTAMDLGLTGKPGKAGKSGKATKAAAAAGAAVAPAKKRRAKGTAAPKAPAVVKFRNEAGQTWGGIGKRPQWLRDALAAGKTLADFAVN
jgi:DNA-binding protein H-NS